MKPGVVIVNTARGAVIDEAALVAALDSGHVASVGLDVYEDEPKIHPGLLANPHVILMPHMGTWTVEVSHDFFFQCHGCWMPFVDRWQSWIVGFLGTRLLKRGLGGGDERLCRT